MTFLPRGRVRRQLPPDTGAPLTLPPGVLGYAVAATSPHGRTHLTHTTLMPPAEADAEARQWRRRERSEWTYKVVEVSAMGDA